MPVYAIDTANFGVRSIAARSPWIVLRSSETARQRIPSALLAAADELQLEADKEPQAEPQGAWLLWHGGERLLQGTATQIRGAFRLPARRFFVPVHFPYGPEWELIGLEPRWFTEANPGQAREDAVDPRIRIGAGVAPAAEINEDGEPWRRLRAALRLEAARAGGGVAPLARLAQQPGLHALLHSLCLRNLIVALLHGNDMQQAEALLRQAQQAYPGYRELNYLMARLLVASGRGGDAVASLQQATQRAAKEERLLIGSGGEDGYRAHCLLAQLAERTGRQQVTVHHYLSGVRANPAYPPSVIGLLRQSVPRALWGGVAAEIMRLARRQPEYQSAIFNFLLLHRDFDSARAALQVWVMPPAQETEFRARLERLAPLWRPTPRGADEAGVVVRGPFALHASTARINRYLAAGLAEEAELDVVLEPTLPAEEPEQEFSHPRGWATAFRRLPRRLDLTIHHGWPPDFSPPATGKLALILPWEFGAVPRVWLRGLRAVDETWVPSRFVRDVMVRAGAAGERIQVIPNGVDLELYSPQGESLRPPQARGVEFLFVGGAIQRKGLDVLLRAWREAFGASDDVSLVIKDLGARSFYRHLNLRTEIEAVVRDPKAAPIVYIGEEWGEAELPRLFRGCDVLALPYRGEGFGMPLAEAMACAKSVIATAAGPAPEFCPAGAGWFVAAQEVEVPRHLWPVEELTAPLTWFEPSVESLRDALRAAAASAEERARRGAIGAQHARAALGWPAVLAQYRERVAALLGIERKEAVA